MSLGIRLATTLKGAGLSPRSLGAITKIHYTTIYRLISQKESAKTFPLVEETLDTTLRKVEELTALGILPFREKISEKEKTDRLRTLLADND